MPRSFNVPPFYRSETIAEIKKVRAILDPKKKDFTPSILDFGPVKFSIARHFGFCFGVENAIEIAYRAIDENPNKRIFLLSEMIHNPQVNGDLKERGVRFIMKTDGSSLIPFEELTSDDIVIVPAFGTTVELQEILDSRGIDPYYYDTTCPFVEKVWKRSAELGKNGFTVIVHGKRVHEETRATFSHSKETAPTIIVLDMKEAHLLCDYMRGKIDTARLQDTLGKGMSENFIPEEHLLKVGVVNQTTMLASETKEIAKLIKDTLIEIHGKDKISNHFADTRDTLCYATNENQRATLSLIDSGADIAVVVGGYNSSNTSHLVELFEEHVPTFYVKNAKEIISKDQIRHYMPAKGEVQETSNWLPSNRPLKIALTSGASCPDRTVDLVMSRIVELISETSSLEEALAAFKSSISSTASGVTSI